MGVRLTQELSNLLEQEELQQEDPVACVSLLRVHARLAAWAFVLCVAGRVACLNRFACLWPASIQSDMLVVVKIAGDSPPVC